MRSRPHRWPSQIKQYSIGEELGHGAFSHVCAATNTETGVAHAIKIVSKSALSTEEDISRFQREIGTMAHLRHPNVVALHDFLSDDENFYLVLDLCPGGELFDYIASHDRLSEPTAALLFQQVISAIAYCHASGVAHRDLKPENVLIVSFPHVKVADFGLCGFLSASQLMRTFCGSPGYCAPECLSRIKYDGRQSDIWSLGILLFTLVTGEHPWTVTNASLMLRQILKAAYTIPAYVSPSCGDLIQSMTKVIPSERITMEGILQHPWLRIGDGAEGYDSIPRPVLSVPVPPPMSMCELSEAARFGLLAQDGVFSPFAGTTADATPRKATRALSFDRAGLSSASARTKVCTNIAHARQRSHGTLRAVAPSTAPFGRP
jgi:serine/threonine protein kinase